MATIKQQRIRYSPVSPGGDLIPFFQQVGSFLVQDDNFVEGMKLQLAGTGGSSFDLQEYQTIVGNEFNRATGTTSLMIFGSEINISGYLSMSGTNSIINAGTGHFTNLSADTFIFPTTQ